MAAAGGIEAADGRAATRETALVADGIAAAEAVTAWAASARRGSVCIYAVTLRLAFGHETAGRVRALVEVGLATPLPQRREGDGRFSYRLYRTAKRFTASRPAVRAGARPRDADAETAAVLDLLKALCRDGRPCPTNALIARRCGLRDGERARYRLRQLREAGAILIDEVMQPPGRVVTIVASGRRSGVIG